MNVFISNSFSRVYFQFDYIFHEMTFSEAFESIPLKIINTPQTLCLLFKRVKSFGIFSFPKCPLSWQFYFTGRVCLAGMKKMARKRKEGDLTVGKF